MAEEKKKPEAALHDSLPVIRNDAVVKQKEGATAPQKGDGYIARPCGYIKYGSRRTGRHDADHTPPPQSVHPKRKQVVQQVVSGGDAVEHLAHPRFFAVLFHHITDNAWSAPV